MSGTDSPLAPWDAGSGVDSIHGALFQASPDALLVVDGEGWVRHANPAASTLLGYTIKELVGLSVEMLVPERIRPQHEAYRTGYVRTPRTRPMGTQMDLVARRCDGSEVHVEIALSPMTDQGRPYVLAAMRNVTEYPRVKQALRQATFSDHVAQLGASAVDTRDPQRLLQLGPEIAASGLSLESACVYLLEPDRLSFRVAGGVGLGGHAGVGERVANQHDGLAARVAELGRPLCVPDLQRLAPDDAAAGLVLHSDQAVRGVLAVPMSERGRIVGVLAVWSGQPHAWDDDEHRFLHSLANLLTSGLQRAQTEEALNHAQRLESVGQLTGGVAHDFNNLLTVIQGNLQVLQDLPGLADDPMAQQLITAAARAGSRAAELTSKLLAFSRRQVLRPSSVDVLPLLDALADMLLRTLDERIRISVFGDAPDLHCLADAGQLETALLNIAINSRDAMPEGGALSFQASVVSALPAGCQVEFGSPDLPAMPYVAIAVSDTGTGMPAAVRERAFEPFFTTKPSGRGTGLGLSTVYGFARQSRGAVAIDSEPGVGTTLTLYLPQALVAQDAPPLQVDRSRVPEQLKVLLVEDEPEVRRITRHFLASAGCQVITCSSAEEALAQLQQEVCIEFLLSDVALGVGLRGTELARRARRLRPDLPILLMSGYSAHAAQDGDEAPVWSILAKPFTREELLHHIAATLARSPLRR